METPIEKEFPGDQEYLDDLESLAYLKKKGVKKSKAWLERGRWAGTGPRFCKIGGRCLSKRPWLDQYLADCENGIAK